ncbi:regulatory protein [Streptomyces sp. OM5714]|nr:regulatory protein [Streptomyces sp. OM5714]
MDLLIDRAVLGVTELLTNVHLHARPDKTCTVEVELLLDRLTVSVRDHDPRLPVVDDAEPLATCGRGLAMVAAMSESWGARPEGESGKVVWFTLPTAVTPAPPTAPPVAARPPRRLVEEVPAAAFAEVEHPVDLGSPQPAPARSAVVG